MICQLFDPGPFAGFYGEEYKDIEIVDGKHWPERGTEPFNVDIAGYKLQRCAY